MSLLSTRPIVGASQRVAVSMPYAKGTGFAMTALFSVFQEVGARLAGSADGVVCVYAPSASSTRDAADLEFDWGAPTTENTARLARELQERRVSVLLGLDIGVEAPYLPVLRRVGLETVISYWGAPISGLYSPLLLALRRIQVRAHRHRPDHFIFESEAMRALAVGGRGISPEATSIVPTGIDLHRFGHGHEPGYLQRELGVPAGRATIVYSGHFEARKGVTVLVQAARVLREQLGRTDFHVVLAGNRDGEDQSVRQLLDGTPTADHVTVAGYRRDLPLVFQDAACGCIPSVGWDSFPMSALEMQAAALPVVVSDLQGVPETMWDGVTGAVFRAGDAAHCAAVLATLLDDPARRTAMGTAARTWVATNYTRESFVTRLTDVCAQTIRRQAHPWRRLGPRGAALDVLRVPPGIKPTGGRP